MPTVKKEFVLRNVFKDISKMEEEDEKNSKIEEHYGIPWKINVERKKGHLGLWLICDKEKTEKEWSIDVSFDMKIYSVNGKQFSESSEDVFRNKDEGEGWGWTKLMKWDKMMKNYVVDDILNVEIHVTIKKTSGIEENKLMTFDESMKEFSDIVLVVEDQKFHVLTLFLARQSTYFEAMFLRNFDESKKEEITLNGIKAEDFQNFLEILHSEPSMNDDTVAGIVHLADMYDTKTVRRQCEEFLMRDSEKSSKEKLELAVKYRLENLKNKCLLEIKTIADIRSVLPDDPIQMDHTIMTSLFLKSLSSQT